MKILAGVILVLLMIVPSAARAQSCAGTGNGSGCIIIPQPMTTTPLGAMYMPLIVGTLLVKAGAGTFYGLQSFGTQLGVSKCFDSVDGSGQQIGGGITLGIGAIAAPPTSMGIAFSNLSCTQTISILGGGVLALYR